MNDTKLPADLQAAVEALRINYEALMWEYNYDTQMYQRIDGKSLGDEAAEHNSDLTYLGFQHNAALDSLAATAGAMIEAEREKSARLTVLLAKAHVMLDPTERARITKEGRERFINEVADVLLAEGDGDATE